MRANNLSLRHRIIQWLIDQLTMELHGTKESIMLSNIKAKIEDGVSTQDDIDQVKSLFGPYSQAVRDVEMLVRFQQFRLKKKQV